MKMKRFVIIFMTAAGCFFIFLPVFGGPKAASAADVRVYGVLTKENVAEGETVKIQLKLENKAKDINAAEIFLVYPKNFLNFSGANDGNSIINMWIEKPHEIKNVKCPAEIQACGVVSLSGLIPGGFSGNGLIAELAFKADKEGAAAIVFDPVKSRIFLNSPASQRADAVFEPINVAISGKGSDGTVLVLDYFPPESFNILLDKTNTAFENKWFISFIAQDKGSGVDHYEIKEKFLGLFGDWKAGESPYVLAHQSLFSVIEVKAIDKTGQERIEKAIPARMAYLAIGAILGVIFLAAVLIARKFFKML